MKILYSQLGPLVFPSHRCREESDVQIAADKGITADSRLDNWTQLASHDFVIYTEQWYTWGEH